jgi:hypothetical protein
MLEFLSDFWLATIFTLCKKLREERREYLT